MEKSELNKFLRETYEPKLNSCNKKAKRNKRLYYIFTWTAIILSASIPFLVLVLGNEELSDASFKVLKWLTASLSAILAIITTAQETFHFHRDWFKYESTGKILRNEKARFSAGIHDYAGLKEKEKNKIFVKRVLETIESEADNRNTNVQDETTTQPKAT